MNEFDGLLVMMGLLFALIGIAMLIVYLTLEKGSILDPISVSWGGYIVFIAMAVMATGFMGPVRFNPESGGYTTMLMLMGTVGYIIGLYATKGRVMARCLPVPAAHLNMPTVWFIWFCSLMLFIVCMAFSQAAGPESGGIIKGLSSGSIGALGILSVMVLLGYRGQIFAKTFMLLTLGAVATLILFLSWSRRPLMGLLLSAGVIFYRVRLSKKSLATRTTVLGVTFVAILILAFFLTATRGQRHYGEIRGLRDVDPITKFLGGITVNYVCMEMTVSRIPSQEPYLMGSGFVPGFLFIIPRSIWPSKPYGSGYVTSQMWYNRERPTNTIPNTILGEWHMNFGVGGVFFGMILVGITVRVMNTYLLMNPENIVLWSAWAIVIPDVMGEWRGDFTSMTVQGLLRVSVFLILAWLSRLFVAHSNAPALDLMRPQTQMPDPGSWRPLPGRMG